MGPELVPVPVPEPVPVPAVNANLCSPCPMMPRQGSSSSDLPNHRPLEATLWHVKNGGPKAECLLHIFYFDLG